MTTNETWSEVDGSHDPDLSSLIRKHHSAAPSDRSTQLVLNNARAAVKGWVTEDGSHDPELSFLIQENLNLFEPSESSTEKILANVRQQLALNKSLLQPINETDSAANDPIFAPAWLELKAAADGAERMSTTIMHEVAGIAYGEITIEQFGEEIDLVYRLLPEHIDTYMNCRVSLTLSGKTLVLGPLDSQGKATLTVSLNEIPVELECHFLPATQL